MGERVEQTEGRPVTVGVVGGTGALGQGLAIRLAAAGHDVVIGSRDAHRADTVARAIDGAIRGAPNEDACAADFVVIAVPYDAHASTLRTLRPAIADRVVIDCVNPLAFDDRGAHSLPVPEGSACEQAQVLLPDATVVGAFHHVSAVALADATSPLDTDVMVVGDDRWATDAVVSLVDSVPGLRGVYSGRLRVARQVEALTANLVAINRRYRVHAGIKISGLEPAAG